MDLFQLTSLTSRQLEAVVHQGSPLMVLAGPGTGKTRTLTFRLVYSIKERGISADKMLAITFTNQAAKEIAERIHQMSPAAPGLSGPRITTFHGFCFRLLHQFLPNPHTLLSENEAQHFLRETVREKIPDFPMSQLKELSRRIALAKGSLDPPEPRERLPEWSLFPDWPVLYQAFQQRLADQKFWDFDELITQTIFFLETNPKFREKTREQFSQIFVDEFQDINAAQYRLFRLLTGPSREWMVIGDPNQAIYGFRGAGADFFNHLREEVPQLTEIHLEDTFRLNQTILKASSQVISASSQAFPYRMKTVKIGDPTLPVAGLPSAEEEARYLAALIEQRLGGFSFLNSGPAGTEEQPVSLADFAVLYRLHAQGELIGRVFDAKGVPYKKVQERHWSDCPEVRQLFARLKSLLPFQGTALKAVDQIIVLPSQDPDDPQRRSPETGSNQPTEAIKKLRLLAATFQGGLEPFLEILSLQTGLDSYEPDQENVKLLTFHAAKGLEFPFVILSGCEANLLPLTVFGESDPEEERRLFYVGLTRATQNIFLTWAKKRRLYGQTLRQSPSPFLGDIEEMLKSTVPLSGTLKPNRPRRRQLSLF